MLYLALAAHVQDALPADLQRPRRDYLKPEQLECDALVRTERRPSKWDAFLNATGFSRLSELVVELRVCWRGS